MGLPTGWVWQPSAVSRCRGVTWNNGILIHDMGCIVTYGPWYYFFLMRHIVHNYWFANETHRTYFYWEGHVTSSLAWTLTRESQLKALIIPSSCIFLHFERIPLGMRNAVCHNCPRMSTSWSRLAHTRCRYPPSCCHPSTPGSKALQVAHLRPAG